MMSERTDPSLRLAPCSSLSMRMDVAAPLADELLAGAGEVAQRLHVGGRHEARADQAMREEIGEPGRVVHVRLAARHSLDRGRVGQGELALHLLAQHSPDRLPVHAGRLHPGVRDAVALQPRRQTLQVCGRGGKRLDVAHHARAFGDASAGHDTVLVDVEASAAGMQNLHGHLPCGSAVAGGARGAAPAVKPRTVYSNMRAPALAGLAQSGVREGLTGQTRMRARGTKNEPTSGPTSHATVPVPSMAGRARPGGQLTWNLDGPLRLRLAE